MRLKLRASLVPAGAALALASPQALPHHSFNGFDLGATLSVKGTVRQFVFTQPHSFMVLIWTDPSGVQRRALYEFAAADEMARQGGWHSDSLTPGEQVTVVYHPRMIGPGGMVVRVQGADGRWLSDGEPTEFTGPPRQSPNRFSPLGTARLAPPAVPDELIGDAVIGSTEHLQLDLTATFHTASPWKVIVYNNPIDIFDGVARSASRICFARGPQEQVVPSCSDFRALFAQGGDAEQLNRLSIVQLTSGPPPIRGVLLQAASPHVDGSAQQTAIWVYDAARHEFRLALAASLGNESRQRLLTEGPMAPAYITATTYFEPGKVRWQPQKYRITVFRYSFADYRYKQVVQYDTAMDYNPETGTPIESELPRIEARLGVSSSGR